MFQLAVLNVEIARALTITLPSSHIHITLRNSQHQAKSHQPNQTNKPLENTRQHLFGFWSLFSLLFSDGLLSTFFASFLEAFFYCYVHLNSLFFRFLFYSKYLLSMLLSLYRSQPINGLKTREYVFRFSSDRFSTTTDASKWLIF